MNWLKQNPFAGGLALVTALAALCAIYFLFVAQSSLAEQEETFVSNSSTFQRLQSAKPYPDDANLKAAEKESAAAASLLETLSAAVAEQSSPLDPTLTPQQFQDRLSTAEERLALQAVKSEIELPEDFYLGFEQYKTAPPPAAAAPLLGQQLDSITEVVRILLESGVNKIGGVVRAPLASETTARNDTESREEKENTPADEGGLVLAPFDVSFTADQAKVRAALSAIISAKPLLLIRLVGIANSQPVGPSKDQPLPDATSAENAAEPSAKIPVLFGKEKLEVKLRIASVSGGAPSK